MDLSTVSLTTDDVVAITAFVLSKADLCSLRRLSPITAFLTHYYEDATSAAMRAGRCGSGNKYFDKLYLGEAGYASMQYPWVR